MLILERGLKYNFYNFCGISVSLKDCSQYISTLYNVLSNSLKYFNYENHYYFWQSSSKLTKH